MSRHDTHHCDWCGYEHDWEAQATDPIPPNWGIITLRRYSAADDLRPLFTRDLCPRCVDKLFDVMEEA
jgi:hypothetical protein